MNSLPIAVDVSRRELVAELTPDIPPLTLGDRVDVELRLFDRVDGRLREIFPAVKRVRVAVGRENAAPQAGDFRLDLDGGVSGWIAVDASAAAVKAALTGLSVDWTPEEVRVVAPGAWLVRFAESGAAPLTESGANRLWPRSYCRVRPYVGGPQAWHEMRLLQTPWAYASSADRVLADPPTVELVRAGGDLIDAFSATYTNEVQRLFVPPDFTGTYYLRHALRPTAALSGADGPEEVAAALNALWADGKTRFSVTLPVAQTLHVEFVGPLGGDSHDLLEVVAQAVDPGRLRFEMDFDGVELAAALREKPEVKAWLEVEVETVATEEDLEDPDAPSKVATVLRREIVLRAEQVGAEIATAQEIDWLTPRPARDYVPFTPGQVITGNQHYVATVGDGVATQFLVEHGLGTEAVHVVARENAAGGAILVHGDAYDCTIESEDSVQLVFPSAPASGSVAVLVTAAGPASVFQAHTHTIGQIEGLQSELEQMGTRLDAIEDLLPTAPPTARDPGATEMPVEIPGADEVFPSRAGLRWAALEKPLELPRPPILLPAIHDATATTATELPGTMTAGVYENTGAGELLVPGGGGLRSAKVPVGGFFGTDGRAWYALSQAGATNSYFPAGYERELFMWHVNAKQLRAGGALEVAFALDLATARANTKAQALLVIEVGAAPEEDEPDPTGINLLDVTWVATPLLSQRIIAGPTPVKHLFGARITRDAAGTTMAAHALLYGEWEGGAQAPAGPDFAIRARLVQWDIESVADARGYLAYRLREASAKITNRNT